MRRSQWTAYVRPRGFRLLLTWVCMRRSLFELFTLIEMQRSLNVSRNELQPVDCEKGC